MPSAVIFPSMPPCDLLSYAFLINLFCFSVRVAIAIKQKLQN